MKVTKVNAVFNLVGGQVGLYNGEITYNDGQTPPTDAEIDTELTRLQAEYDSQEYARNRKEEYPPWEEQLEKIFDDGLTKWKTEMIQPVKDKYPKP
jgi:hypothetical protein